VTEQQNWDCRKAGEELDAFVRGELRIADIDRMKSHLDRCGHCAEVAKYERAFRERLRSLDPDTCCPEELRQRIREMLAAPPSDS
jgi:anti-sigma factor (TIGR02949 family)